MTQAGQAANKAAKTAVFADYLSRRADNTIKTQRAALALFADFLAAVGVEGVTGELLQTTPAAWQGVTWGLVEAFTKWLLKQGYSVATVNNRLTAVKTYAKLAAKAGAISTQELALIRTVNGYGRKEAKRIDERRPVTRRGHKKAEHTKITQEQAAKLKQHPDTPQGRRDCLLMCLLLEHGLRVGEVARLQVTDFDLKRGELRFYRPKVDKIQTHTMTADTLRAALAYFEHDAAAMGPVLLASTKTGELVSRAMSERAITKRVEYLGRQLGISSLSPHDLRHYWATRAAAAGTDPFRLQEAGGWSSLAMPRRYVEAAAVANEGVKLA